MNLIEHIISNIPASTFMWSWLLSLTSGSPPFLWQTDKLLIVASILVAAPSVWDWNLPPHHQRPAASLAPTSRQETVELNGNCTIISVFSFFHLFVLRRSFSVLSACLQSCLRCWSPPAVRLGCCVTTLSGSTLMCDQPSKMLYVCGDESLHSKQVQLVSRPALH